MVEVWSASKNRWYKGHVSIVKGENVLVKFSVDEEIQGKKCVSQRDPDVLRLPRSPSVGIKGQPAATPMGGTGAKKAQAAAGDSEDEILLKAWSKRQDLIDAMDIGYMRAALDARRKAREAHAEVGGAAGGGAHTEKIDIFNLTEKSTAAEILEAAGAI